MKNFNFEGLSNEEVTLSRYEYGSNELPTPESETFWEKLVDNFKDPLIKILCVALGITTFLAIIGFAEWIEGIGIATAVFIATFVSTYSEYKNEASFQELQRKASQVLCNVFRNGKDLQQVPIDQIVVRDLILLESGSIIPADGIIISGTLSVNQQNLTGEPVSVNKVAINNDDDKNKEDPDDMFDPNLVFRGCVIDEGEAIMQVTRVGQKNGLWKISN